MERIWEIVLLLALIAFLSKAFLFEKESSVRLEQPAPLSRELESHHD